ncbi:hypothetical protein FA95DRAFT_990760 [Auriscalpium vulgare]|uniref:Uncharacterized protein n=1 Tax=Auriscalpium vulgare TaxID=40419 RepID=A0ACB8R6R1_9AGAM|nr:hypothetical protein FA95DRAFT_990760 [Auriscalpium vulgare]
MQTREIPPEIWQTIFDWAIVLPGALEVDPPYPLPVDLVRQYQDNTDPEGDIRAQSRVVTCARLRLVCRSWSSMMLPRLYEYVYVATPHAIRALAQALQSSDARTQAPSSGSGPSLGSRIKHVKVLLHGVRMSGKDRMAWCQGFLTIITREYQDLEAIFGRAHNLEVLELFASIYGPSILNVDSGLTTALGTLCSRSLRRLALRSGFIGCPLVSDIGNVLVDAPHLRALWFPPPTLLDCGWEVPSPLTELSFLAMNIDFFLAFGKHDGHTHKDQPPYPHLQRLLCHVYDGLHGRSHIDVFAGFIRWHGPQLTSIDIVREWGPASDVLPYISVLARYCPNLMHLGLYVENWTGLFPLTDIPASVTALSLQFRVLPKSGSSTYGLPDGLADIHSASLRHVRICGEWQVYGWFWGQIASGNPDFKTKIESYSFSLQDANGEPLLRSPQVLKHR